ncbi:MAG: GlxA family transcriptional regulator [Pantoea sp.]|uniref:GlxA family transcriptional regulator n=1 Tax=Pantoea phytobeneficialis TaxID=2052056 RepID=A0AAP9KSF0_9GAMM|nr:MULTISPECIES: GlxA family transcriptional regulator [Pantoea]ERK08973.1 Transcriptional regulator [Pantoea sp. AS-PWVM4]MDO6407042.1 GlxA family transcriptional regulator [Pantoea phytobeneficialis]QGR10003.1 GlxA family transcriptional regulator [Pantoea phytobeneficialis]
MHRVGLLIADQFQSLALSTLTIFEFANLVLGEPFYQCAVYSEHGGQVSSSFGISVTTIALSDEASADTWLIGGVLTPVTLPASERVVHFLKNHALRARRVAGICTGAFVLAQAGLLSERRATTHWAYAQSLKTLHPTIRTEDDLIYIIDHQIWTSAGMTAGLDMVLAMVEKDHGSEVARSIAQRMVMNQRRSGGQRQHSELLALSPRSDRLQTAIEYIRSNLTKSLSVEQLADAVHLSSRQLNRLFLAETGKSPARVIERLRLEAARLLIEQTRLSLDVVARDSGFRDRRHMRDVFMRGYGIPPQALRTGKKDA